MTNNNTKRLEEQTTIEERWVEIFASHGVNRQQADLLTKATFGVPQISKATPLKPEIRDIVEESLHELEYAERLDASSDPEEVREELLSSLDNALAGAHIGPLSAPDAIAFNTGGIDSRDGPGAVAEPEHGRANEAPRRQTEPDDGEVDKIQTFLEDLIDEQDLAVPAVKLAVERIDSADDNLSTDT